MSEDMIMLLFKALGETVYMVAVSMLIATIIGVLLAGIIVVSVSSGGSDSPLALVGKDFADTAEWLGLVVFLITLGIFGKIVLGNKNN